mgnify:CR=1 FL=1
MERFGLFIALEPGITGLMPKSLIAKAEDPAAFEKLNAGDEVTILVQDIRPKERKITLSPVDVKEEEDWRSFASAAPAAGQDKSAAASSGSGGLNLLGDKLAQAMRNKG